MIFEHNVHFLLNRRAALATVRRLANSTSSSSASAAASHGADPTGLRDFENDIIALFVDMAGMFGLPRSYGEIYGLLYASMRPLSFTDIQERLDLSKGSVSQGLRALRDVGAIRPSEGSDDRREHFIAETELRTLISGFLKESILPQLQRGSARVEGMKASHRAVLATKNGEGRLLQSRLEKLHSWHRKGGALLPLIAKFLR